MRAALALLFVLIASQAGAAPAQPAGEAGAGPLPAPAVQVAVTLYQRSNGAWEWLEITGLDGSAPRAVTATDGRRGRQIRDVAWSPDGTRVAFVQTRGVRDGGDLHFGDKSSLWVVDADGSDLHPVATWSQLGPGIQAPLWSPDGGRLAFVRVRESAKRQRRSDLGVYTVRADGSGLSRLVRAIPRGWADMRSVRASVWPLAWNASDDAIVYVWNLVREDEGNPDWISGEIFSIAADGTDVRSVAQLNDVAVDPVVSPDFERVAYVDRNGWVGILELETGTTRSIGPNAGGTDAEDSELALVEEIDWVSSDELVYLRVASTSDYDRLPESIRAVDIRTGEARILVRAIDELTSSVTVLDDGGSLAYLTSADPRRLTVQLLALESGEAVRYPLLTPPGTEVSSVAIGSS